MVVVWRSSVWPKCRGRSISELARAEARLCAEEKLTADGSSLSTQAQHHQPNQPTLTPSTPHSSLSTMANPRQRSKSRSKTHNAVRTTKKTTSKKVTVNGPKALVDNWDRKKTVLQK